MHMSTKAAVHSVLTLAHPLPLALSVYYNTLHALTCSTPHVNLWRGLVYRCESSQVVGSRQAHLVRVPLVVWRHTAHIAVGNAEVRVYRVQVGEGVVPYHVLLAPHEGAGTHLIDGADCSAQQHSRYTVHGNS